MQRTGPGAGSGPRGFPGFLLQAHLASRAVELLAAILHPLLEPAASPEG
jgi:hypothetical protein